MAKYVNISSYKIRMRSNNIFISSGLSYSKVVQLNISKVTFNQT